MFGLGVFRRLKRTLITSPFNPTLCAWRPPKMLRRAAALLLQLSALRPAAAVFVSEQCFPWSCIEMCKADANCDGIVYVANQNGCTFRASMNDCDIVFAISPNSASCERVFALLKNLFGEQQMSALADYVQASLMLNYNGRRVG